MFLLNNVVLVTSFKMANEFNVIPVEELRANNINPTDCKSYFRFFI